MTSIALSFVQSGKVWLFDCGEGTQQQILRAPVKISRLERVFLTHLHGDHLFGLPGLLASRSLIKGALTPLTLQGPDGLEAFVRCALDISRTGLRFPLAFAPVADGLIYENEACQVMCRKLAHGVDSYGYAIEERPRRGELDTEKLHELGVPFGPLFGRLKRGETIVLADGRFVDGRELVGPDKPGPKVVICGDTGPTRAAIELAQNADVLVHEATFMSADVEKARQVGHSTAADAAFIARAAGVKTLILTHFSARYESDATSGLTDLLAEARAIFPETRLASDFSSFDIPLPS